MSPRSRKTKAAGKASLQSRVNIEREDKKAASSENFIDKIQNDLEKNQSYLNLILGALIVIVLGVLIFNYFNKPSDNGEVTQTAEQTTDEKGDVTKANLPGTYTVKEGDTLFLIAQKYYDDGNLYTEISKENNLTNDSIEVGQKLIVPKLSASASASPEGSASASPEATIEPSASPKASSTPEAKASITPNAKPSEAPAWGKGGATNQTTWGETITGSSYTVNKGDWLSTIAGRAYGDIMQYQKIAKANNISNPDVIEVGMVLKIPRD